jgi:hypothetical protein
MAVILSLKAWPNSSASGALAFVIASHLYIGSKDNINSQCPFSRGISEQIGLLCLLAVLHVSTGATIMKGCS